MTSSAIALAMMLAGGLLFVLILVIRSSRSASDAWFQLAGLLNQPLANTPLGLPEIEFEEDGYAHVAWTLDGPMEEPTTECIFIITEHDCPDFTFAMRNTKRNVKGNTKAPALPEIFVDLGPEHLLDRLFNSTIERAFLDIHNIHPTAETTISLSNTKLRIHKVHKIENFEQFERFTRQSRAIARALRPKLGK